MANTKIPSELIADNAVGITQLNVSDGSDGQALTTNGAGTLSFSTISGTTINNNADNRLITGSGTANTLNGEAAATFDSNGVLKIFTAGNNTNGGNIMLGPSTDDATKYGSITAQQYDSGTETEGFGVIGSRSTSTSENAVYIGGDIGEVNAATQITLHTAANTTTRGGTERLKIDSSGVHHINGGLGFKGDAITSCSGFSGTAGHYYWIKPPGALEPVYAQYSGDNYKSRGKGYFAWWRGYSEIAPSPNTDVTQVNFLDFGFKFYELLVEDESNNDGNGYYDSAKSYEWAYWSSQQTFNQTPVGGSGVATSHSFTTGNNVRTTLGRAGGHGLYDSTVNSTCSWGNISVHAAIGSGYSGSCGTYNRIADTYNTSPLNVTYGMNLIMGRPGAGGAASANFQRSPGPFTYWCNF